LIARILKASLAEAEDHDTRRSPARAASRGRHPAARGVSERIDPDGCARRRPGHAAARGTVLVERIFSYEGIGNMAIDAVINRDFPLIQGLS